MKHRTLEEIRPVAQVVAVGPDPARAIRRERLERLATLLESYNGPLRLLSRMEFLPEHERMLLRDEFSPLTVAFRDPLLRAQGLKGDCLGDAMRFFDLSSREAHYLLCDCHHYTGAVTRQMLAERTRSVARRQSMREVWHKARTAVTSWWS
jgi:hypothetical protein